MPLAFIIVACRGLVPCGVKLNLICVFCALECPAGRESPHHVCALRDFSSRGRLAEYKVFLEMKQTLLPSNKGRLDE